MHTLPALRKFEKHLGLCLCKIFMCRTLNIRILLTENEYGEVNSNIWIMNKKIIYFFNTKLLL